MAGWRMRSAMVMAMVIALAACRHDIDVSAARRDATPSDAPPQLDGPRDADASLDVDVSGCPRTLPLPQTLGALLVGPAGEVRRLLLSTDQTSFRYEGFTGERFATLVTEPPPPLASKLTLLAAAVDAQDRLHLLRVAGAGPASFSHAFFDGSSWGQPVIESAGTFKSVSAVALAAGRKTVFAQSR